MIGSVFVPSRNSRHRTAALALYRALLRVGKQVPLSNWEQHPGHVHPAAHVVRKRFAKNKAYTSLRLVYASMAAGYKFLTLLTKAKTPESPEHAQVVQQLRILSTAPRPRKAKPEYEPRPPLLTKVSGPHEPPRYISTTRPYPKSAFTGERKIPRLTSTAEGVPFLRIKKPQPRVLSRAIGRKNKAFIRQVSRIVDIDENEMPSAEYEDKWETMVQRQMKAEGLETPESSDGPLGTYKWSVHLSRVWFESRTERTWQDWVARGKALHEIVEQENALAIKEKQGSDDLAEEIDSSRGTSLPFNIDITASTDTETVGDPFISEKWMEMARKEEFKYDDSQRRSKSRPSDNRERPSDQSQRFATRGQGNSRRTTRG